MTYNARCPQCGGYISDYMGTEPNPRFCKCHEGSEQYKQGYRDGYRDGIKDKNDLAPKHK